MVTFPAPASSDTLALPALGGGPATGAAVHRPVHLDATGTAIDCPVRPRDRLAAGTEFAGPALVQEYASTTVLFDGDAATVADTGELIITLRSGS